MKEYLDEITLEKNTRGVWILDPFKGCSESIKNNNKGCYGLCYATQAAKCRGYNFSKVVKRDFTNKQIYIDIIKQLKQINYVRMGSMCDPSHNWDHTLKIVDLIKPYIKNIVIVTKHLNELTEMQLIKLNGLIINTSVSALDDYYDLEKKMFWYYNLVFYCKSILRVNTAKFNLDNEQGIIYNQIQNDLISKDKVIDTVLRFPKKHRFIQENIILTSREKFMSKYVLASKNNPNTYLGYCANCKDKCGIYL